MAAPISECPTGVLYSLISPYHASTVLLFPLMYMTGFTPFDLRELLERRIHQNHNTREKYVGILFICLCIVKSSFNYTSMYMFNLQNIANMRHVEKLQVRCLFLA